MRGIVNWYRDRSSPDIYRIKKVEGLGEVKESQYKVRK